jgi:hypothetical protein
MPRTIDLIRASLEKKAFPPRKPSLDELKQSEWVPQFEQYMRNRLIMGAIRYQPFAEKRQGHNYDLIGSIRARLDKYEQSGNQEHLVDCANLLMIEFDCPSHPDAHFEAIDDGTHVQERSP